MALINCPECGKEISDTSTNCIHCGYHLSNSSSRICVGCGAALKDDEDYCEKCGAYNALQKKSKFNLCKVLSIIVLVSGIVCSLFTSYRFGLAINMDFDGTLYTRDWISTITIFIVSAFSTVVLYAILSTLGKIQDNLDRLSLF